MLFHSQLKELQRLLGTAKDKDRQELILDALQSLSTGQRLASHSQSPGSTSPCGNISVSELKYNLNENTLFDTYLYIEVEKTL